VSLLCKDNVESRVKRGKSCRRTSLALDVTACRCFVKKKEFGIEHEAEATKRGTLRNNGMLKLGWVWGVRTTVLVFSSTGLQGN
jgi:hypothetical protein